MSRPEYLLSIYYSIPENADVVWHIAKSRYTPDLADGMKSILRSDKRVRLYEIECEDTNTPCKMNYIFHKIMECGVDSYFCIQDDDSVFLPEMYEVYQEYKDKQMLVVGKQVDKEGRTRLQPSMPCPGAIDTGNFLCHSGVLVHEPWPNKHWSSEYYVDYEFINAIYKRYGVRNTDLVDRAISIYNKMSTKPDTLDYIRE
jgi:hypothetical protein